MAEVRLAGISKRFDKQTTSFFRRAATTSNYALRELTLEIVDKEFFTLVGPSGCGKSTALNIIAGLEIPSSGRVYFDRDEVTALEPRARDVAMVFQSYALYPHMTVFQNIAFPLELRKFPKQKIRSDVGEIAEALGLSTLLTRRPIELSGGQRQRVALARALVRRPKVFLLDEPLSNLDARLRIDMRTEIRRIAQQWKVTTIYVTHDQEEAMVLSDRVAVLRNGQIEQIGAPLELYQKPGSRFVAEFVGTPPMNFFPLTHAPTLAELLADDAAPADITVGVRPQDLHFAETGKQHRLPGKAYLRSVELTGPEQWLEVEWEGRQLRARTEAGSVPPPGRGILSIEPKALHFFTTENGARRKLKDE